MCTCIQCINVCLECASIFSVDLDYKQTVSLFRMYSGHMYVVCVYVCIYEYLCVHLCVQCVLSWAVGLDYKQDVFLFLECMCMHICIVYVYVLYRACVHVYVCVKCARLGWITSRLSPSLECIQPSITLRPWDVTEPPPSTSAWTLTRQTYITCSWMLDNLKCFD